MFKDTTSFLADHIAVAIVLNTIIIICCVILANYLLEKFFEKLIAQKSSVALYKVISRSADMPCKILLWCFGIAYVADNINILLVRDINNIIIFIKSLALIVCSSFFIWQIISNLEINNEIKQKKTGKNNIPLDILFKVSKVVVTILAVLTLIETNGIKITGILALGSVGGIIFGIAGKDLLANFFGAAFVYLDSPFKVGDWIRSPDKNIEGTVESISWRLTKIRTFDKRPLFVPNAVFNSVILENASRMSHRRMKEIIGVRYTDIKKVKDITKAIKLMLLQHDEIDKLQTILVSLIQYSPSSVDIMVYCFSQNTNWIKFQEAKQDIMLKINDIIEIFDAEIAFPTQTLYLENKKIL